MIKKMKRVAFVQTCLFVLVFTITPSFAKAAKQNDSFATRLEVQKFIQEMQRKHDLDPQTLKTYFKQFKSNPKVIALMNKQFEALPWHRYQNRIVTDERMQAGLQFWNEHEKELTLAAKKTGVPAEIIVAILGIETSYGKIMGKFPVLQTLATLAFDYPRRAAFFRQELEHFLLLTHEGALHPTKTLGSYAGAMGLPQFMPSSYRHYAIDFSGTGKRDLIHDTADVIGSVANYLTENGWKKNERIAYPTTMNAKKNSTEKVKWIVLIGPNDTKEYWIGTQNFKTIMRYNNSTHYAMAVFQLGEGIRALKKNRG